MWNVKAIPLFFCYKRKQKEEDKIIWHFQKIFYGAALLQPTSMKRYRKDSFYWYKKVVETQGRDLD